MTYEGLVNADRHVGRRPVRDACRRLLGHDEPGAAAPPLRDFLFRDLDPRTRPVRYFVVIGLGYLAALVIGRLLVLPDSGIAALWPSVGVGYLWMLPYLSGRWWHRPMAWLVLASLVVSTCAVNLVTGMDLRLVATTGPCNAVAAFVACRLYLRGRAGDGFGLATVRDLRLLILYCGVGTAVSWFTFPLTGLLIGVLTPVDTAFWILRNGTSLFVLALAPSVFWPGRAPRVRGVGVRVVVLTTAATLLLMAAVVPTSASYVLAFVVVTAGIGTASVFSVAEVYVYLLGVTATVTVATVLGYSPFGGDTPAVRAGFVHAVMVITLTVAVTMALDRQERLTLVQRLAVEQANTAAHAERVRTQAQLLATIVDSMSEGVLVLDGRGQILLRNRSAVDLAGVTDGEDMAGGAPSVERTDSSTTEDIRVGSAGSSRILTVQTHPIEDPAGARSVLILRDVTEDRRHVDELQTFARAAAHDLRQPLTIVQMWVDTLRADLADTDDPAHDEALEGIEAAAARMDLFLTNLLGYAVARDGRTAPERLDVGHLAAEVVAARLESARGLEPEVVIDASDPIHADRSLIWRLLDNLVGNALKYTHPGQPARIRVTTAAEGSWVILRVDDEGIGLPQGQEERVFDEFHRVRGHASAYPGTGLGLSLCRRIVERHGGAIRAVRLPGGGTRFEARLPAADPPMAGALPDAVSPEPGAAPDPAAVDQAGTPSEPGTTSPAPGAQPEARGDAVPAATARAARRGRGSRAGHGPR